MSSTMIPPLNRIVLAASGARSGRHFHKHLLGLAIIREQLADGDVLIEDGTNESVTRMRTEHRKPVPRGDAPTDVIPIVWPELTEPETARIILGIPFRRDLPPAR